MLLGFLNAGSLPGQFEEVRKGLISLVEIRWGDLGTVILERSGMEDATVVSLADDFNS
jgi:hypothetical protein